MFKVQDLMIDVLAHGGGGGVMMPTPTEPTPPSPISPVASAIAYSPRFEAIDAVVRAKDFDVQVLDQLALDVGRMMVGVRIAALCSEDMPTCENNERISPFASQGLGELRAADFGILHDQVRDLVKWTDERGDLLEKRAIEAKKELLPRMKRAVEHLESGK